MTRERFIKKWLGNKDYQYTEENRDLMRDDLDEVINQALRQPLVIGSAKRQANKKFGFEKKPGIFAIVKDYSGRREQSSFTGSQEIFAGYDLRKYEKSKWAEIWEIDEILKVKKEAKEKGWDVIEVSLHS
jgi:hypothetical protein